MKKSNRRVGGTAKRRRASDAKPKSKKFKRTHKAKDASSGEFVSEEFAAKHPRSTYWERLQGNK